MPGGGPQPPLIPPEPFDEYEWIKRGVFSVLEKEFDIKLSQKDRDDILKFVNALAIAATPQIVISGFANILGKYISEQLTSQERTDKFLLAIEAMIEKFNTKGYEAEYARLLLGFSEWKKTKLS